MTDFMAGKIPANPGNGRLNGGLLEEDGRGGFRAPDPSAAAKSGPLRFSPAAKKVFDAGRALWKGYHARPDANPDASLYDIRECFQGRGAKGRMNARSGDEAYSRLMGELRAALSALAKQLEPKVYEHGFLLS
jgi:hypothetical protein